MFGLCGQSSLLKQVVRKRLVKPRLNMNSKDTHQAPVVRRVDNTIHRINRYPVDRLVCAVNTYRLDSDFSGG